MNKPVRPLWVIEQSLNFELFNCCGDEDLFPFRCYACLRPLVLCYECETLYLDLHNLSTTRFPAFERYCCPQCSEEFDDDFMRSPRHRIGFDAWHDAALDHLLIERPFAELSEMLTACAAQLADFLRRGMRSTVRTRITEYRNLAESIAHAFPNATAFREQGKDVAHSSDLAAAMAWHSQIPSPINQAYALLGIADTIFPESTPNQPQPK